MPQLSLLWPEGQITETWTAGPETVRDLEIESIIQAMCTHGAYREDIRAVLLRLCQEEGTIRYRQEILKDLLAQHLLADKLNSLLPLLDELTRFTFRQVGQGSSLQEVIARARELELLVEIMQQLNEAFASLTSPLQSTGLAAFAEQVNRQVADQQFQEMVKDLPDLLDALRSNASITVGINLDHHLRPEAAVLLSVNEERFTDSDLLDRLLGRGAGAGKGIAPIHRPPEVYTGPDSRKKNRSQQKRIDPMLMPLFKDLAKVLEKISAPVAQELKKYVQLNGRFLAEIFPELIFYTQAVNLIRDLQKKGMSLTFPEILPADARICRVQEAYNFLLAIQKREEADPQIISNMIDLGDRGRIAVLTGPNQGGKTTYMQSIGLVQLLAQTGLPVPGQSAIISPVDAIYTHYPIEERLELGTGRFGDEAQRIRAIFEKVTSRSLVLFNESLSTTSVGEGVFLAHDIIKALRQIGLRAVFTTHLHELAADVEKINADFPGDSIVFSLVASRPDGDPGLDDHYNYQIHPGPPLGRSYAEYIATRYGISDNQLQALLQDRGLV